MALPVLPLAFLRAVSNLAAAHAQHEPSLFAAFRALHQVDAGRARCPPLHKVLVGGYEERRKRRPVEKLVYHDPLIPAYLVARFHEFDERGREVLALTAAAESLARAARVGVFAASIMGVGLACTLNSRRKQRGPKLQLSRNYLQSNCIARRN